MSQNKFALLVDLGIITIPEGDPATQLARFKEEHGDKFYYYNKNITDEHFSNPSRILQSGDKLWVRAFEQVVDGTTTSEERMAFLATQKPVYTGAQGATVVFEQKHDHLPKGTWYTSFDEKEHLWENVNNSYKVPRLYISSFGDCEFCVSDFECPCAANGAFFCFSEVK